jgi:Na+-transporting NADH:ubiquinone oxidoreductase subunit C
MNNDSPAKAFLVILLVAVACSSLVSAAVVILRPIQLNNQLLDRSRNVMHLTGLLSGGEEPGDEEMLALYRSLDSRIVDIDAGAFDNTHNPDTFDKRRAVNNPELSLSIPAEFDQARLGRRSRYAPVYLVWRENGFDRIILPIRGAAMWSTLYGFLALEADLNTIAAATFYEQNETPGLGDQVTRPDWLAQWKGRQIYNQQGELSFAVGGGRIEPGSPAAQFQVDALTGATVTADAVTALVHYWLGPHGFQPFLDGLREQPPEKSTPAPAEGT